MKRSLGDDDLYTDQGSNGTTTSSGWPSSPAASIHDGPETIDSPAKRSRSTPPPVLHGPLYFSIAGGLAPSTIPLRPSNMPGVRRLVPREAPLLLQLAHGGHIETTLPVFLSSTARKIVLVFENAAVRVDEAVLAQLGLAQCAVVVNNDPPTPNSLGVPTVQDPTGSLARECRVLEPLGGGVVAAPCLVLVMDGEVRGTAMLGRSLENVARTVRSWI